MGFAVGVVLSCFLIYFVETVDDTMKVKELYIKKYHQFEDFKLDLTYPEGHEKAGQPLDKVCFIGQSGTGKTSLLDFIELSIFNIYSMVTEGYFFVNKSFEGSNIKLTINGNYDVIGKHAENNYYVSDSTFNTTNNSIEDEFLKLKSINNSTVFTLSFPVDFININEYDFDDAVRLDTKFLKIKASTYKIVWDRINLSIVRYRESEIQQSLLMSEALKKDGMQFEDIQEAILKQSTWEQNNPNPLQDLADRVLDKILNKFNLRVRTRLDFEKIEDVKTIKIETLDGQEVPYDFQSTGTRQVFLSMLPLYTLNPNRTAIFFDEPERSLYPDIQKEIVDIYTSLTTDCQFFYATHSPIIASSFEPWEIVELKFNPKTGTVFQELYYEEEKGRHVDNYTINPQYLRWDDILQRVFDLDSEGNEKRVKALMKLATLESKLKKNNITSEEREKLWQEYLKLSKLTGWTTRMTNEKN